MAEHDLLARLGSTGAATTPQPSTSMSTQQAVQAIAELAAVSGVRSPSMRPSLSALPSESVRPATSPSAAPDFSALAIPLASINESSTSTATSTKQVVEHLQGLLVRAETANTYLKSMATHIESMVRNPSDAEMLRESSRYFRLVSTSRLGRIFIGNVARNLSADYTRMMTQLGPAIAHNQVSMLELYFHKILSDGPLRGLVGYIGTVQEQMLNEKHEFTHETHLAITETIPRRLGAIYDALGVVNQSIREHTHVMRRVVEFTTALLSDELRLIYILLATTQASVLKGLHTIESNIRDQLGHISTVIVQSFYDIGKQQQRYCTVLRDALASIDSRLREQLVMTQRGYRGSDAFRQHIDAFNQHQMDAMLATRRRLVSSLHEVGKQVDNMTNNLVEMRDRTLTRINETNIRQYEATEEMTRQARLNSRDMIRELANTRMTFLNAALPAMVKLFWRLITTYFLTKWTFGLLGVVRSALAPFAERVVAQLQGTVFNRMFISFRDQAVRIWGEIKEAAINMFYRVIGVVFSIEVLRRNFMPLIRTLITNPIQHVLESFRLPKGAKGNENGTARRTTLDDVAKEHENRLKLIEKKRADDLAAIVAQRKTVARERVDKLQASPQVQSALAAQHATETIHQSRVGKLYQDVARTTRRHRDRVNAVIEYQDAMQRVTAGNIFASKRVLKAVERMADLGINTDPAQLSRIVGMTQPNRKALRKYADADFNELYSNNMLKRITQKERPVIAAIERYQKAMADQRKQADAARRGVPGAQLYRAHQRVIAATKSLNDLGIPTTPGNLASLLTMDYKSMTTYARRQTGPLPVDQAEYDRLVLYSGTSSERHGVLEKQLQEQLTYNRPGRLGPLSDTAIHATSPTATFNDKVTEFQKQMGTGGLFMQEDRLLRLIDDYKQLPEGHSRRIDDAERIAVLYREMQMPLPANFITSMTSDASLVSKVKEHANSSPTEDPLYAQKGRLIEYIRSYRNEKDASRRDQLGGQIIDLHRQLGIQLPDNFITTLTNDAAVRVLRERVESRERLYGHLDSAHRGYEVIQQQMRRAIERGDSQHAANLAKERYAASSVAGAASELINWDKKAVNEAEEQTKIQRNIETLLNPTRTQSDEENRYISLLEQARAELAETGTSVLDRVRASMVEVGSTISTWLANTSASWQRMVVRVQDVLQSSMIQTIGRVLGRIFTGAQLLLIISGAISSVMPKGASGNRLSESIAGTVVSFVTEMFSSTLRVFLNMGPIIRGIISGFWDAFLSLFYDTAKEQVDKTNAYAEAYRSATATREEQQQNALVSNAFTQTGFLADIAKATKAMCDFFTPKNMFGVFGVGTGKIAALMSELFAGFGLLPEGMTAEQDRATKAAEFKRLAEEAEDKGNMNIAAMYQSASDELINWDKKAVNEAEEQTKIQRNIETLLSEIKTSRGGAAADVAGRAMIAHGEAIATANNTSENYATESMFAKSLFANVALGEKLKDINDDPAALISAIVAEPLPEPVGLSLGELANRAGISKAILSSTDENSVRNIAKTYYVLSNILKQVSDNAALFDKNLLQTNLVNYFKSAKTMNDVFVVNATSQKMLMDVFASSFKSKAEIAMVTASQKNATSGYYGIGGMDAVKKSLDGSNASPSAGTSADGGDNPRDLKYSTLVEAYKKMHDIPSLNGNAGGLAPSLTRKLRAYAELTGQDVDVVSGYRAHDEQAALHKKHPEVAAAAGFSRHQLGVAADVRVESWDDKVAQFLGLSRPDAKNEPWHIEETHTAGKTLPQIVGMGDNIFDRAMSAIIQQEGTYSTINPNDNGKGVSVGRLQWNSGRAHDMFRRLREADPATFDQSLPRIAQLLGDISLWTNHQVIFQRNEVEAFKRVMQSPAAQKAMDAKAREDLAGYFKIAAKHGISDPWAQAFYADIINQYGPGGPKRGNGAWQFVNIAGPNPSIDRLYDATSTSEYKSRRKRVYDALKTAMGTVGTTGAGEFDAAAQAAADASSQAEAGSAGGVSPADQKEVQAAQTTLAQQTGMAIKSIGELMKVIVPTVGSPRVSSPFGNRKHPLKGGNHFHPGIDIAGVGVGNPVHAMDGGKVVTSKFNDGGYGHYVVIQHPNGLKSLYAHMTNRLVSVGQDVTPGQQIGSTGSTGASTGPHLHFEIARGNISRRPRNPGDYIDPVQFASSGSIMTPEGYATATEGNGDASSPSSTESGVAGPGTVSGSNDAYTASLIQAAKNMMLQHMGMGTTPQIPFDAQQASVEMATGVGSVGVSSMARGGGGDINTQITNALTAAFGSQGEELGLGVLGGALGGMLTGVGTLSPSGVPIATMGEPSSAGSMGAAVDAISGGTAALSGAPIAPGMQGVPGGSFSNMMSGIFGQTSASPIATMAGGLLDQLATTQAEEKAAQTTSNAVLTATLGDNTQQMMSGFGNIMSTLKPSIKQPTPQHAGPTMVNAPTSTNTITTMNSSNASSVTSAQTNSGGGSSADSVPDMGLRALYG